MALTIINSVVDKLVAQMRALGSAVAFVSDVWSGGDLPWRNIMAIEQAFQAAAITASQVMQEAAVNPEKTQEAIIRAGSDLTLTEFGAGVAALQAASAAWYDLVMSEVHALPPSSIIWSHSEPLYRQTRFISNFPEAVGLRIKNSDELANLRAELAALGAI